MKNVTLILGFMLCLAVCWTEAAPAIMKSDAGFGGAQPVYKTGGAGEDAYACGCTGTTAGEGCPMAGCSGTMTHCDVDDDSGSGHCGGAGNDPCTHTEYPDLECGADATCT